MQLWNKQKTSLFANSWRRSRVILIEKHFKPICSKITSRTYSVTIRKRYFVNWANVELVELCETIPKVQCSECFFWNQGVIYCTCGHLLKESESSRHLHQWRSDAFSIQNYVIKQVRLRGARHGKSEAQKEHFIAHTARRRCLKNKFDGLHDRSNEIQHIVIRNSKLAGLRWSASRWIHWHRKTIPIAHLLRSTGDFRKLVYVTELIRQKCTDETPIRLPSSSHNYEPTPPRIWRRAPWTNPPLSIPKVAFVVFFFQYFMVAVEWKLVELIFSNLL